MLSSTDNKVCSLDDPNASTDLGNAFTAKLVSARFGKGAWAKFREFVQQVFIATSATVGVTPVVDDSEAPSDRQAASLTTSASGSTVRVQTKLAKSGTRFQIALDIPVHSGRVEIGESERVIIPRRTQR